MNTVPLTITSHVPNANGNVGGPPAPLDGGIDFGPTYIEEQTGALSPINSDPSPRTTSVTNLSGCGLIS